MERVCILVALSSKVLYDMELTENEKSLFTAARVGDDKSVKKCLADRANVNCKDNDELTPLHWAAQNGHISTVKLLILNAAAISSKDKNGLTPLHCAAGGYRYKHAEPDKFQNRGTQEDHIAIVDFLISKGCKIDSKDVKERTPYDLASFDDMKNRLKTAQQGIDAGIPYELLHMDKKSVDNFKQLLKEDTYKLFELRSMLQGEQGTGKTTIARFLVGKRPTLFRMSTDGIDLYTGLSFFDYDEDIWIGGKQDFTLEDIIVSRTTKEFKKPDISKQHELAPGSSSETKHNVAEPIQRDNTLEPTHAEVQTEQTTNLQPTISTIMNPSIIDRLKTFFGVKKEVHEIKVSVTKENIYEKSRKVVTKKFYKRNLVPVTIWDFGGQDVFYSTHQTFLTYRAVYMLILDGSRTLNEDCKTEDEKYLPGKDGAKKTQEDYVRFWINTIITYCKGDTPGFPKIIVILTHKDKLKEAEIDKRRKEIFGEIDNMFDGTPIKQHLAIEDEIFVNARNNNDPEMQQIKHSLIKYAKMQPTWGQKLPKCFLPLELEIQYLINKDVAIITIEEIKKINEEQAVRPLTDSELKLFLKFQHSVGKILYFDEPNLDGHIIISPTFLIDAFKSIITEKQFCKGDKQKEEAWYTMAKKGVILKQAVETIWKQKKYIQFFNFMKHLLSVMSHLDILVEPRRYDTNHCRIPTEFYYVASMVRTQDTTEYLKSPTFSQRNIAILFKTSSSIIPPALSFRFISYCLSIWGVKTYGDDKQEMLFHRSAVLTIDPSLDIHIKCEDDRLIVRLVHAKSRSLIMRDLASSIRECLFAALEKISKLYIRTSSGTTETVRSFDVNVCCSSSTDPCSIAIQDISGVWLCPVHNIEHGKDLVSSWFTVKGKEKCESFCPVTDPMFLKQYPTELHLRRLALIYNNSEVKDLVMELGLPFLKYDDLLTSHSKEEAAETLRFRVLEKCFEMKHFSFEEMKSAAKYVKSQNLHAICKVVRDEHVHFDKEPEKWDLIVTDEDIDKLSPSVGGKYLDLLVELGLTFSDWEKIQYKQKERDLFKLNREIMEFWKANCKVHNIKPALRTIGQAFGNIGINIKIIENLLFN